MKTEDFTNSIKLILPCYTVYCPGPKQIKIYLLVNNHPVHLCYNEDFINKYSFEFIMNVINNDLFDFANGRCKNE